MRVVVAEGPVLACAGLTSLVQAAGHAVAGVAHTAEEVPALVGDVVPDAVVTGPALAAASDSLAARVALVRERHPAVGVVVLGRMVPIAGSAVLAARIDGAPSLDAALAAVAHGGVAVEPERSLTRLTPRENAVLRLMASGLSNQGIAERMRVTTNTVGTHVQHVFDKLGLPDEPAVNRRVLAVLAYLAQ
jgi:DNA-binding NarL/FixJ family response regulator